jgi:mono/diheme cytochrome c family protein
VSGLYKQRCAKCHGTDGAGNDTRDSMPNIPDFTSRKWQERRTKSQLLASILDGRGTQMPAFREKVNDRQAQDLVAHIKAMATAPKEKAASPGDFEERLRQLYDELEDLKKQTRDLAIPSVRKPR